MIRPEHSQGRRRATGFPLAACALLMCAIACHAQTSAQTPNVPDLPEMSPQALVQAAVANEAAAAENNAIKHMFRSRKQTPKGSQTKLYVETDDALAAMLIAINDQSLTPQQQQGEVNHLAWLVGNPEQLRKKHAREKEDAERSLRIVKALPEAFRYEYDGTVPSEPGMGRVGDQLVRLKFRPNPGYSPPSRVEQVLEGMEGYLLIDATSKRLARIDGTLFKDVSFGWGIIGHLDKGGRFLVKQADLGDGTWDITEMKLDISGKILLFKSLHMESDEVFSDFERVPDHTTFAQGVHLLTTEREKLAHGAHSIEPADAQKNSR